MGGMASQQQSPVYYDQSTGQYYTQTPQNQFAFSGSPNGSPLNASLNSIQSMFGRGGERTYLNGFGQSKAPVYTEPTAGYVPTIAELFPLMQGTVQQASEPNMVSYGAGRFLSPAQASATGGVLNSTGNKTT